MKGKAALPSPTCASTPTLPPLVQVLPPFPHLCQYYFVRPPVVSQALHHEVHHGLGVALSQSHHLHTLLCRAAGSGGGEGGIRREAVSGRGMGRGIGGVTHAHTHNIHVCTHTQIHTHTTYTCAHTHSIHTHNIHVCTHTHSVAP